MQFANILRDFYMTYQKECTNLICILNSHDIFPSEIIRYIIAMYINDHWTQLRKCTNLDNPHLKNNLKMKY
jgi:hypothetical protein